MFDKPLNCIATFTNHNSWVYGVVITSDNEKLVSTSGSQILVWDLKKGNLITTFEGHSQVISSLELSPDGKKIASGSFDKKVKLWDIDSATLIYTFSAKKDPISSVTFSPNGNILASGGGTQKYESKIRGTTAKTREIYLWNPHTGKLIRCLAGHNQRIKNLVWGVDGNTLVSNSDDNTIKIWNPHTGELLHTIETPSHSIIITPDGENLISYGDGGIKIWNLNTRSLLHTISPESSFISCCAISPDGKLIASGFYDISSSRFLINIYDFSSINLLHSVEFLYPKVIVFSPDSSLIASGDCTCFSVEGGGFVKVWELPNNPPNKEDAKKRVITSIVQRQGQGEFRKQLLKAYEYQCCITGYDAEMSLEAAHIISYNGSETNYVSNGLLLRADIHTLFDLHQISIHPDTGKVVLAPSLINTCYAVELLEKYLRKPNEQFPSPQKEALKQHYEEFTKLNKNLF